MVPILDSALVVYVLGVVSGVAASGMFLFLWLGAFEPWMRRRRYRAYNDHVKHQFEREDMIHRLEVVIATTNDPRQIQAAQLALYHLKNKQQISREVFPVLHPPKERKT